MANIQSLTTSQGGLALTGFSTNSLDTQKLVEGLTAVQNAQIKRLEAKKTNLEKKQEAIVGLQTRLQSVATAATRLGTTFTSVFDQKEVSSSSTAIATAAAGSGATPGTFTFSVEQLAVAEQRATQAFASTTTSIATGTLVLQQGTGVSTTITIDGTNNTLAGLADAINGSGADVSASLVRTSTGATPYQLILSGRSTGASQTLTITNNLSGGGGITPTFTTVIQSAADAEVILGSGPGAITVTSASNTLQELVPGLTVQLRSASPGTPVTLTVANDIGGVKEAVSNLVGAYNEANSYLISQSTYNATTNESGPLFADGSIDGIQNRLLSILGGSISGLSGVSSQLGAIGISFGTDGSLQLDEDRLDAALAGEVNGVDFGSIRRLFVLDGVSGSPQMSLLFAPNGIKAVEGPITVRVTQAATQGSITATNPLALSTVIDGTNNLFSLSVDGQGSGQLSIAAGTYTPAALASALETAINSSSLLGGSQVGVSLDGSNRLVIQSRQYGSSSRLSGFSGLAASTLGFAGSETGSGLDVQGSYSYQGVTEEAVGIGQILRAPNTNTFTSGLETLVTLSSVGVGGTSLELRLTSGIGSQLSQYISTAADNFGSILARGESSVEDSITGIEERIAQLQTRLDKQKDDLIQRFAAMDALLARLQNTQTLIKQTIDALNQSKE